jgi:ribosome recycling factor
MTEEIEFILDSTEESMIGSIAHRVPEHSRRKASPAMLGKCFVDYYGSAAPLSQRSKSVFRTQER